MSLKAPSNRSRNKASTGPSASAPNTTPSSRYELTEKDKNRVRDVDQNNGRCIVENCDEVRAVKFAHVCPKWFTNDEKMMESVEWFWNLSYLSLNLNTRYNVLTIGAAIHTSFDRFSWVLVPEESVVNEYHNSLVYHGMRRRWFAHRQNFPHIPDQSRHKYRFIPTDFQEMHKVAIYRQDIYPDTGTPMSPHHFTIHTYPFASMPELACHVHPKFVILEAGYAMNRLGAADALELLKEFPILIKIAQIYQAWTAPLPTEAMDDQTYNMSDDSNPGGDKDSTYTERRRLPPPPPPMPASNAQRSQPGKGKGRQHVLKRHCQPSIALSKKSLELHDNEIGEESWTEDAIQTWSKGCRRALPDLYHMPWTQLKIEVCV